MASGLRTIMVQNVEPMGGLDEEDPDIPKREETPGEKCSNENPSCRNKVAPAVQSELLQVIPGNTAA